MTAQEILTMKNNITKLRMQYASIIIDIDPITGNIIPTSDLITRRNEIAAQATILRDNLQWVAGDPYDDSLYTKIIEDNIDLIRRTIISRIYLTDHIKDMDYWNTRLTLYGIKNITVDEVTTDIVSRKLIVTNTIEENKIDKKLGYGHYDIDSSRSNINKYYKSFAGSDAVASLVFPDNVPITLGQVHTLSYSIYRKKTPIQTLGRISPRGYTKGSRTVAGTVIFNSMDNHWVNEVRNFYPQLFSDVGKIKSDELPPFDIIITMANEYGSSCYYVVYGATVVEEGQVVSTEDPMMQNVCQFMARDIDIVERWSGGEIQGSTKFRKPDYDIAGTFKVAYSKVDPNGSPIAAVSGLMYNPQFVEETMLLKTEQLLGVNLPSTTNINAQIKTTNRTPIPNSKYNIKLILKEKDGTPIIPTTYTVQASWKNKDAFLGEDTIPKNVSSAVTNSGIVLFSVDTFSDKVIDNGSRNLPKVELTLTMGDEYNIYIDKKYRISSSTYKNTYKPLEEWTVLLERR